MLLWGSRRIPTGQSVLHSDQHTIRDYSLDNAKAVLILLVVFAHLIEPLIAKSDIANLFYLMIYAFHMPAFVMISGMLSKNDPDNPNITKAAWSPLVPFIIFSILYEIFFYLLAGKASGYGIRAMPFWIMWFLISLFAWRLLLPYFLKLKYPLLLSVLLAITAGYLDGINYTLGISRIIYFFPLFLAGHLIAPHVLNAFKIVAIPRWIFYLFGCLMLLVFVLFSMSFDLHSQWLWGSKSYSALGNPDATAGLFRLALLGIGFVLSLTLILAMPRQKLSLSNIGQNSLFIYVWHGFFVLIFWKSDLLQYVGTLPPYFALLILFVASIALAFGLSRPMIAQLTRQFLITPATRLLTIKKPRPVTG